MLSNYFCTLTLLHDRPFSSYRPSIIAASCLLLATRLLANQSVPMDSLWSDHYIQLTSYTQSELNECTLALAEIHATTYHQDKTTSSLLRRYLKTTKDNELPMERVRDIIHSSKVNDDDDDEEDDVLDLTLDEFDENQMSMDHHR